MKSIKTILISLLLVSLIATCAAAKTKQKDEKGMVKGDEVLMSNSWTELAEQNPIPGKDGSVQLTEASPELLASWWRSFGDETLTSLIEAALKNNRDLSTARSAVRQARAQLGISRANVLPWLSTTDAWTRSRNSEATYPDYYGAVGNVFHLGIDASWEIDIFGGQAQNIKASEASYYAQYSALYSSWVSLSAEIAADYIALRTYQERLDVARSNLALQQETYELVSSRYEAGLVDALDLNQSKSALDQTRAAIPSIETNIETMKNAIAILTGEIPGTIEAKLSEKGKIPVAENGILIGIPANMIRQRPDIRAAEQNLYAQFRRRLSSERDLLPKIYFTGSIGTESLTTGSLFDGPNKLFSFGPQLSLPLFRWGSIRRNITVQTELELQALNTYETTVLNAVGEVRDALTATLQERQRNASLASGEQAAREALEIAQDKYKAGLVNMTTVISAQQALLSLSENLVISDGQISTNSVQLFKALGGGWAPLDAEAAARVNEKKK